MKQSELCVVTGGASGIGAACVQHLVRRGDRVVVIDLPGAWNPAKIGVDVDAVYAGDVTDESRLRQLADQIQAEARAS